uniref:Uncharacterized protein n=1 Tax=Glossina pallidipes TaxID=7398 RepID=A0A1B0ACS3_GLOPL
MHKIQEFFVQTVTITYMVNRVKALHGFCNIILIIPCIVLISKNRRKSTFKIRRLRQTLKQTCSTSQRRKVVTEKVNREEKQIEMRIRTGSKINYKRISELPFTNTEQLLRLDSHQVVQRCYNDNHNSSEISGQEFTCYDGVEGLKLIEIYFKNKPLQCKQVALERTHAARSPEY